MGYSLAIREQFPNVMFTGGSRIHKSLARYATIKHGRENVRSVMAPLLYAQAGQQIFTFLRSTFPGMEWIIKGPELSELLIVDFYRHLTGLGDSYTKDKLKNPVTGNRFHQVALKDKTVCGIRVWADSVGSGTQLAYRFRLEEQLEKEATVRGRAAQAVIDAHSELVQILDVLQLPPPTTELCQAAVENLQDLIRPADQPDPDDYEGM